MLHLCRAEGGEVSEPENDVQMVVFGENEWKMLSILRAQGYWVIVLLVVIALELLMLR